MITYKRDYNPLKNEFKFWSDDQSCSYNSDMLIEMIKVILPRCIDSMPVVTFPNE